MQKACDLRSFLILAFSLTLSCSNHVEEPTGVSGSDLQSLTGVVTRIDDKVPVDGGVTLELTLDTGAADTAYLASFFTFPPPPPERYHIYRTIRALSVGARVKVEGERTALGLEIRTLIVLG